MTVALIIYHSTHPVRIQVPFLILRTSTCPTPIFLGMNVMRAYGIDILCSTANPRVRIGTFGHGFALMNKPDLSPRLQALDPASPASFEGKPTSEPAEFAALVENSAINPDLTSDQRDILLHTISSFPMAFAHGSHKLGSCPDDQMTIEIDMRTPMQEGCISYEPPSPRSRGDMGVSS
jgi:hypothetical protein